MVKARSSTWKLPHRGPKSGPKLYQESNLKQKLPARATNPSWAIKLRLIKNLFSSRPRLRSPKAGNWRQNKCNRELSQQRVRVELVFDRSKNFALACVQRASSSCANRPLGGHLPGGE